MPELPEVEAARSLVDAAFAGRVVTSVIAVETGGGPRDSLFDEIVCSGISSAGELSAALVGKRLVRCCRKGKQMWWQMASSAGASAAIIHPTWHFGMTGAFTVRSASGEAAGSKYKRFSVDASSWPPRFTKVRVGFDNGAELAFTDPRRLARVRLVRSPESEPPVSELGPDALLELPPLPSFEALLAGRSTAIKALLLDQSFLAGIGNWVADEVLYQARLHPETAAHALDKPSVAALHGAIRSVLEHAVSVGADSAKFPSTWLFHSRWGKGKGPAKTSDGKAITFVTVGGRTSAVVPSVQGAPKSKPADHVAAILAARTATARAAAGATLAAAASSSAMPKAAAAGGRGRVTATTTTGDAGGADAATDSAQKTAKPKARAKAKASAAATAADSTVTGPAPVTVRAQAAYETSASSSSSSSSTGSASPGPSTAKAVAPARGRRKPRAATAGASTGSAGGADSAGPISAESAGDSEPPALTGRKRSRATADATALASAVVENLPAGRRRASAASNIPSAAEAADSESKSSAAKRPRGVKLTQAGKSR